MLSWMGKTEVSYAALMQQISKLSSEPFGLDLLQIPVYHASATSDPTLSGTPDNIRQTSDCTHQELLHCKNPSRSLLQLCLLCVIVKVLVCISDSPA